MESTDKDNLELTVLSATKSSEVASELQLLSELYYKELTTEEIFDLLHRENKIDLYNGLEKDTKSAAWFMLKIGLGLATIGLLGMWLV